jgi:hypothetical protein
LFDNAVRNLDYTWSNDQVVVNTELQRIWMEVVMVVSWQYPGGTQKNHRRLQSYPSFELVTIKIEIKCYGLSQCGPVSGHNNYLQATG